MCANISFTRCAAARRVRPASTISTTSALVDADKTTLSESKSAGERRLRRLVRLRDNLAHAQDVVSGDWDVLVEFARALDRILALGSAFARPRRTRRR